MTVVHRRGALIETLEDLIQLILGNLLATVAYSNGGMLVVVGEADAYLATCGSELKGIREDIHDDLVEIGTVDPYRQFIGVVVVDQADTLCFRLSFEEHVDILNEGDEVRLRHTQLHLSLVNLTEIHHLIDQAEDTLGITTDGLVDTLLLGILFVLDERQQGRDDQRHRRTDLVTHVHEEAHLGLTQFLSVQVFLQAETRLFTMAAIGVILPEEETDDHGIEEIGPCRTIPGTVDNDRKLAERRFPVVALRLDAEAVSALRQMGEGQHIHTWLQADKRLAIDTIQIRDVFGILVSQR